MRLAIAIFSMGALTVYAYPQKGEGNIKLAVGPPNREMHSGLEHGNIDMMERISTGMLMRTTPFL